MSLARGSPSSSFGNTYGRSVLVSEYAPRTIKCHRRWYIFDLWIVFVFHLNRSLLCFCTFLDSILFFAKARLNFTGMSNVGSGRDQGGRLPWRRSQLRVGRCAAKFAGRGARRWRSVCFVTERATTGRSVTNFTSRFERRRTCLGGRERWSTVQTWRT